MVQARSKDALEGVSEYRREDSEYVMVYRAECWPRHAIERSFAKPRWAQSGGSVTSGGFGHRLRLKRYIHE